MVLYQAQNPSGSVLGGLASTDIQIQKQFVEVLCWKEGTPVSNSYKFILEVGFGSEAPPGNPYWTRNTVWHITKK